VCVVERFRSDSALVYGFRQYSRWSRTAPAIA
jgi:hypothetical protein